jgi:hypothetical protein
MPSIIKRLNCFRRVDSRMIINKEKSFVEGLSFLKQRIIGENQRGLQENMEGTQSGCEKDCF